MVRLQVFLPRQWPRFSAYERLGISDHDALRSFDALAVNNQLNDTAKCVCSIIGVVGLHVSFLFKI